MYLQIFLMFVFIFIVLHFCQKPNDSYILINSWMNIDYIVWEGLLVAIIYLNPFNTKCIYSWERYRIKNPITKPICYRIRL